MKKASLWVAMLLAGVVACGVKKSPQPPAGFHSPTVKNLMVLAREDHNLLRWSAPPPEEGTKQTPPERFFVIRREWSPGTGEWSGPVKVADTPALISGRE